MILNLDELLAPLDGPSPSGTDTRADSSPGAVYFRIKDARASARAHERQADVDAEQGFIAPEWRLILDLAQDVLAKTSKDIEIAAWLTEAVLRLHGYAGLRDGFMLLSGLMERFWDTVYSFDLETVADKIAPIAGLNGATGDGALIQPIRLAPLTAPVDGGALGQWHVAQARRRGPTSKDAQRLKDAAHATNVQTFIAIEADLSAAIAAWAELMVRMDALCGADSPPTSNIRNVLDEAYEGLREISGLDFAGLAAARSQAAASPVVAAIAAEPEAAEQPATPAPPPAVYTREDALRELSRVADYFREHEPHSPIAWTLETLIRRARLPLTELWVELIPDENVRRTCLTMAGIAPASVKAT